MNIKAGDKVFHHLRIQDGFSSLSFWKVVTVTRTTKTLIIIGDERFKRKYCFGVDLFRINEETKQEAAQDNHIVRHKQLCSKFWTYNWDKVDLEKLLQIEAILKDKE